MTRRRDIGKAVKLYEAFREAKPRKLMHVRVPLPKAAAVIGYLEGVDYRTTHGKRIELYHHDFEPGSRPLLAVSADGKQLLLLGGRYQFTEQGIVDKDARGRLIKNPKHGQRVNPRKREKGYIVWNYWDHKIIAKTPNWKRADAALKEALEDRGDTPASWYGIEAVEDIHSDAIHNPRGPARTRAREDEDFWRFHLDQWAKKYGDVPKATRDAMIRLYRTDPLQWEKAGGWEAVYNAVLAVDKLA